LPKILAKAGDSLADIYDVEGSIAGIQELVSSEVHPFHEMGATIFSERLSGQITRITTGAIAQNITWEVVVPAPATTPARILGVFAFADVVARTTRASLSVSTILPGVEQDFPVWAWDTGLDAARTTLMENAGAVSAVIALQPVRYLENNPSLLIGTNQAELRQVPSLTWRGLTAGFGAGTVTVDALIYLAFADQDSAIASRGLPIPGW